MFAVSLVVLVAARAGAEVFRADDVEYEMPQGWKKSEYPGARAYFILMYKGNPIGEMFLGKDPMPADSDLGREFNRILNEKSSGFDGYTPIGTREHKVSGLDFIVHDFLYYPSGSPVQFGGRAAFTMVGGSLYSFTFNTTANYFSSLSGIFNETIQSVRPAARAAKRPDAERRTETGDDEFEAMLEKARAGDAEAQTLLGAMYAVGKGVEQDWKKAAEWYTKAADQGYARAQFSLGTMYEKGQGVEKDYKKAIELYRKAADQGEVKAQFNLGAMYQFGKGVEEDYKKAAGWYLKAAKQGDSGAQAILGMMYADGIGVKQDYKKALKWLKLAAEQGSEEAKEALKRLGEE